MSTPAMFAAFIRRDWANARSYRLAFALSLVGMFFSLALFFYLSRLVDDSVIASKAGLERGYFAFAVVGISLLEVLRTGMTSFAGRLRSEQTTGTFEALMATPAPPSLLIIGSAAYDLLRATLMGVLMIGVAIALFGLRIETGADSLLLAIAALAGCVGVFAALGVALAAFTVVFKQTAGLLAIMVSSLAMLGGAYFPIEVMPSPLEEIGRALPFTWGLDVLRSALLAGELELGRLLLLFASGVAALPAALVLFRLGLRRARKEGSLAQY
jgi:ABC-2 type transport system permease protein